MSLFSWLSRSKPARSKVEGAAAREPARPAAGAPQALQRKSERTARRELLYSVVRESMAGAGVLSTSYKFKVLSLDSAGRQFLVMVDLASSDRLEGELLSEIEQVIAQRAKTRHGLVVSAVYWRRNDQIGGAAPRAAAPRANMRGAQPAARPSQPAELASEPAVLQSAEGPGRGNHFDPIQDDELEALRAALADGLNAMASATPAPRREQAPRASGFAPTQARDDGGTLSATQHGDLT